MNDGQQMWWADAVESRLEFTLRHLVLSQISGIVRNWRATISIDHEHPERSSVDAVVDAGSLDTTDPSRDEHIRSPEFLHTQAHPEIRFRSRRIDMLDAQHLEVAGDLTIRGVSRPVTLMLQDKGRWRDAAGRERAAFQARTTLNRQDFGLRWNQDLDTGGVVVGDKVDIELHVNAIADAEQRQVPRAHQAQASLDQASLDKAALR